MDDRSLLLHLEGLADSLGIEVRYERLDDEIAFCSGGLCRINGKSILILNKQAATGEILKTIGRVLSRFELGGIYMKPALREFIDSQRD